MRFYAKIRDTQTDPVVLDIALTEGGAVTLSPHVDTAQYRLRNST